MARQKVGLPALMMVVAFTVNIVVNFWDSRRIFIPREAGWSLLVSGGLFWVYILSYLREGFFGNTEPVLDRLVTDGPYKFCRHPLYLSFILIVFGFDLLFGSVVGIASTVTFSIPSTVYRGWVEDRFLREKFGEEWDEYADRVGFLFPRFRRYGTRQDPGPV